MPPDNIKRLIEPGPIQPRAFTAKTREHLIALSDCCQAVSLAMRDARTIALCLLKEAPDLSEQEHVILAGLVGVLRPLHQFQGLDLQALGRLFDQAQQKEEPRCRAEGDDLASGTTR